MPLLPDDPKLRVGINSAIEVARRRSGVLSHTISSPSLVVGLSAERSVSSPFEESESEHRLRSEINLLRDQLAATQRDVTTASANSVQQRKKIAEYQEQSESLQGYIRLSHIVDRVSPSARDHILAGGELKEAFERQER